jgi:hypothetical protein
MYVHLKTPQEAALEARVKELELQVAAFTHQRETAPQAVTPGLRSLATPIEDLPLVQHVELFQTVRAVAQRDPIDSGWQIMLSAKNGDDSFSLAHYISNTSLLSASSLTALGSVVLEHLIRKLVAHGKTRLEEACKHA